MMMMLGQSETEVGDEEACDHNQIILKLAAGKHMNNSEDFHNCRAIMILFHYKFIDIDIKLRERKVP
jgi:hypothetical protein